MDLANGYLAHTMHEQNLAAADRINAYRRRVAERRALEAQSASAASTALTPAGPDRSRWDRMVGALTPSGSHGHPATLPSRP
ncbi:hypothetical protein [Agromyces humi]|uniref:hypothetical protein n=1 Tax=Agromyces humi TaxID=1766800 RepID=UPI001358F209|nr:hypothetical protein [Agromyces humi]